MNAATPIVSPRRLETLTLALATVVGVTERYRIAWAHRDFSNGGAGVVARSVAQGRGFADVFFAGSGPSAHLLPTAPLIGAASYRVFGYGGAGDAVRIAWACLVTGLAYALAAACARRLGTPRIAVLLALILLWLLPVHGFTEAVRWQLWDGGIATVLALGVLWLTLNAELGAPPRSLALGALTALAMFVNPIFGITAGAIVALYLLRWRRIAPAMRAAAAFTGCALLLFVPWTLRNASVMGAPIVLRDNLGVELAMANYPEAVPFGGQMKALTDRLNTIHPSAPAARKAYFAAGGEVGYSRLLLGETERWMAAHPGDVARIWARHASEMLFPQPWVFGRELEGRFGHVRVAIAALLMLLALAALGCAAMRRDARFGYAALYLAVPTLLGLPFQTVGRYCWPLYPLTAMLAADMLARLWAMRAARASARDHPPPLVSPSR